MTTGTLTPEKAKRLAIWVCQHPANLASLVKIPLPDGPVPFDLWPSQREALHEALNEKYLIILKARQLGVTWVLGALLGLWECMAYPTGETLVLSKTEDDAKHVIERANFLYDSLPPLLQAIFPRSIERVDRIGIQHGPMVSSLISLSSAGGAGRSRTFRRVIADERAHWENSDERMASIKPTIGDVGKLVELSTAKGYNSFRDTYLGAVDPGEDTARGNGYRRLFFGALARPDRDEEWVERERRNLGMYGPQELPLTASEAFLASGNCVFEEDSLHQLLEGHCTPPVERVDLRVPDPMGALRGQEIVARPNGNWEVWSRPREGRRYVVAADPCGGGAGRDFAYAFVADADSWDQVAAFHGRPEPVEFARQLFMASVWYNDALLAPEVNNHGQAVVAALNEWRYPNLYRRRRTDQRVAAMTEMYGWETTVKSRAAMLGDLKDAIRHLDLGIRDAKVIGECLTFVEDGRGREEAEEGNHDDRVLATAIATHVLAHAPDLKAKPETRPRQEYIPRVSSKTGY